MGRNRREERRVMEVDNEEWRKGGGCGWVDVETTSHPI
jgi:hypothetical protein